MAASGGDLYEELGVRPVINAQGNRTVLGGSSPSGEVKAAMDAANLHYVEMEELLEKAGRYIAGVLGAEAAQITSGCGAALALSAAACMTGEDPDRIMQLPDTTGMKSDILVQKGQRYSYERCYTVTGGRLVEVGDESGCTPEQLEAAIGPNTAAVARLIRPDWDSSVVSLEDTVRIAHEHGVPVIADGSAQIYPWDYFRRTAQSADLVCFGAKYMGAPTSTGFVCGKKPLVDAVVAQGFIGFHTGGFRAIGRPMKVDRHGVVAVVAALKRWLTMDHESRLLGIEEKLSTIRRGLQGVPNVRASLVRLQNYWGSSLEVVMDTRALGKSAEEVVDELANGNPRVWVTAKSDDTLEVNAHTLNEGEEKIVSERLRSVLLG